MSVSFCLSKSVESWRVLVRVVAKFVGERTVYTICRYGWFSSQVLLSQCGSQCDPEAGNSFISTLLGILGESRDGCSSSLEAALLCRTGRLRERDSHRVSVAFRQIACFGQNKRGPCELYSMSVKQWLIWSRCEMCWVTLGLLPLPVSGKELLYCGSAMCWYSTNLQRVFAWWDLYWVSPVLAWVWCCSTTSWLSFCCSRFRTCRYCCIWVICDSCKTESLQNKEIEKVELWVLTKKVRNSFIFTLFGSSNCNTSVMEVGVRGDEVSLRRSDWKERSEWTSVTSLELVYSENLLKTWVLSPSFRLLRVIERGNNFAIGMMAGGRTSSPIVIWCSQMYRLARLTEGMAVALCKRWPENLIRRHILLGMTYWVYPLKSTEGARIS